MYAYMMDWKALMTSSAFQLLSPSPYLLLGDRVEIISLLLPYIFSKYVILYGLYNIYIKSHDNSGLIDRASVDV